MRAFSFSLLVFLLACGQKDRNAVIHTTMGDIRVRLFGDTPGHRDHFAEMAGSGAYDSLAVSSIERDFVVQCSAVRPAGAAKAAFPVRPSGHPLLRGAVAANGASFFIVQGRPQTDASLDKWEKQTGQKFDAARRGQYKKSGGAPQLEGRHTVFGEVTAGLDVVDKIAALPRDASDRPLLEVRVWVEVE